MDKNNFIRQVMKERGWTIERLASQMTDKKGQRGITQSAASQIINGNPTLAKLQEIADILGVPVGVLICREYSNTFTCPNCGKTYRLNPSPMYEDETNNNSDQ